MANESTLVWDPLKKAMDKMTIVYTDGSKRGWDYQRLESRVGIGIPDVNIHIPHVGDVWAELKYATFPRQDGREIKVGLEPEQYIWMRKGARAGRKIVLIARVSPRNHPPSVGSSVSGPNYWRVWVEEKFWELAKHPAPMDFMMANSQGFPSPELLLLWLGDRGRW